MMHATTFKGTFLCHSRKSWYNKKRKRKRVYYSSKMKNLWKYWVNSAHKALSSISDKYHSFRKIRPPPKDLYNPVKAWYTCNCDYHVQERKKFMIKIILAIIILDIAIRKYREKQNARKQRDQGSKSKSHSPKSHQHSHDEEQQEIKSSSSSSSSSQDSRQPPKHVENNFSWSKMSEVKCTIVRDDSPFSEVDETQYVVEEPEDSRTTGIEEEMKDDVVQEREKSKKKKLENVQEDSTNQYHEEIYYDCYEQWEE